MLDVKARWGNRGTERRGPGETEGRSPREKEAPELHQALLSPPANIEYHYIINYRGASSMPTQEVCVGSLRCFYSGAIPTAIDKSS